MGAHARRFGAVVAVMLAGGVGAVAARAQPDGDAPTLAERPVARAVPAPDAGAQAAQARAEAIITVASAQAKAVITWFNQRGAELSDGADVSRVQAERWLKEQVAYALAKPAAPTGVRLLRAGAAEARARGEALFWPALDAAGRENVPERLVLLVHGLDESGSIWDDLAPLAQARGLAVARFDYPNDQAIAVSADALAAALRELKSRGVGRVDLVAHSMGALVCRDVLTRGTYYGGNAGGRDGFPAVERFIAAAPPNHGAPLAGLERLAELREQVVRWLDGEPGDPRLLLGFLKDGAGEAADDLAPGSAFLSELNARPLPRGVAMTIIAGTIAGDAAKDLQALLDTPVVESLLSPEARAEARAALAQAATAVGDGVVPLDSTRLEGVEDFVRVSEQHRLMLKVFNLPAEARELVTGAPTPRAGGAPVGSAVEVILDRLARPVPGR